MFWLPHYFKKSDSNHCELQSHTFKLNSQWKVSTKNIAREFLRLKYLQLCTWCNCFIEAKWIGRVRQARILLMKYWYQADVSWCHEESWFDKKLFHLWASRADYWWWECRLRKPVPVPVHRNLNIRLLQDWTEKSPRGRKIDDIWELLNRLSFSCPVRTAP